MATYRALDELGRHYLNGGDEGDLDLSAVDEQDALSAGRLEIVPRTYRVLSDNYAAGKQGETVELALLKELEAALLFGGVLERVDKPVEKPAAKAAQKKEK